MEPNEINSEFRRVWDSHNTMSARMQDLIGAVATISALAQSLCSKIDNLITNGMNRCTSHEERLKDLEAETARLSQGAHPICMVGKARWEDTNEQIHSIRNILWSFIVSVITSAAGIILTLLILHYKGVIVKP